MCSFPFHHRIRKYPHIKRDRQGHQTFYEDGDGYWAKQTYDDQGNEILYENSKNFWYKWEYDREGNPIHYEDSSGYVVDKRHKPWYLSLLNLFRRKLGMKVLAYRINR